MQAHDNAPLGLAPLFPGARYNLRATALLTGLSVGYIRWLLHTYADRFDPRVEQVSMPSGKPSTRFPRRLLSARDVDTLRSMFPVRVKPNRPR